MSEKLEYNHAAVALILPELQRQQDELAESALQYNNKATSLLEWSSLSITVATGIGVSSLLLRSDSPAYLLNVEMPAHLVPIGLLVVTFALYLAVVFCCLRVLWPREYHQPIHVRWEDVREYLVKSPDEARLQLVSQYVDVIESNKAPSAYKSRHVKWALVLFPAMVVCLVVLVTYPLWIYLAP